MTAINEKLLRINVVGTSGTGKSHFSKQLAERLNIPRIEMDILFWEPNWQQPSDEVFFKRLTHALDQPKWILDGNYNRTVSIKWKNATTVIWIDYPFHRVLFQAVNRAISRALEGNELWPGTGNKESIRRSFFSKDSIILWTLKTFWKVRTRYESTISDPQYGHIQFIRIKTPRQAKDFLESL